MNRKDTILVAVLINAGVLVVLFTSALKNKQSDNTFKEPQASVVIEQKFEPVNIMKDEIELAIEEAKKQQAAPIAEASAAHELTFDTEPAAATVIQEAPQSIVQQTSLIDVTVKKGDFLAKIAKRHGVSVEEIMKVNHLKNTNLKIGQVLKVPSAQKAITSHEAPVVKHESASSVKYYTVKPGDNPWTIANKHKMKVEELLKLNNLTSEKAKSLKVGDKLKVKE